MPESRGNPQLCRGRLVGQIEVDLALAFAEDALVLERGRIAFRGKAAELQEDESLQHRLLAIGER